MEAPFVSISNIRQKVRNLLYEAGLNGLCCVEAHPFRGKLFDEELRRCWFHVHAIIWTRDPIFDHRILQQDAQQRFPNELGANGLVITTRADYVRLQKRRGFSVPDPDADMTAADIAYLVSYMLKCPNMMKRLTVDPEDPDKRNLATTGDGYSGILALQMARIRSMMAPFDAVFAVREGSVPRAEFSKRLRSFERENRTWRPSIKPFDVDALWHRVATRNPSYALGRIELG